MVILLVFAGLFVIQAAGRHVGFHADNRLDVLGSGGFVELDGAAESAVVGHGHGRHAAVFDMLDQLGNFSKSVQQAVLRVVVQVHVIAGAKRRLFFGQDTPQELLTYQPKL